MADKNVEIWVSNVKGTKLFKPPIKEGVEWTTERRGTPGKLTFTVVDASDANFSEGSAVRCTYNDHNVFYGFIFKQQHSEDGSVAVTAYDQLRYLQNKDTIQYKNKTASQVVKMIADNYQLNTGKIMSTSFKIESRTEENTSLFDIIENALDLELTNKGEMFVLYDNFGKLTLRNLSDMYVEKDGEYLLINAQTAQSYDYTSSIDDEVYNRVKLTYDNSETGKREVYIAQSGEKINKWGILQYFDTLSDGENGKEKAKALLNLYKTKSRSLKIKDALGDRRVRAGSLILVDMDFGDTSVKNFMLVEKCVHKFNLDEHFMDLTLRGGEFDE